MRTVGLIPVIFIIFAAALSAAASVSISVDASKPGDRIPREVFGNNVAYSSMNAFYKDTGSIPEPMMRSVLEMGVPSSRYPGGCFADSFTFEDAIGPKQSRKEIWINGCRPPAYKFGVCYFGVDEFLQLCEKWGAEPVITLQFRHRDGQWRTRPSNGSWTSSKAGDTVKIAVFVPRDGFYRLNLRVKTGTEGNVSKLSGSYSLTVDGSKLDLKHHSKTPVRNEKGRIMGMLESDIVLLRYGSRELEIAADQPGLFLDYVNLVEFNHDNSVKRAMAWVAYCNGSPDDTTLIGRDEAGFDWKTVGYWATLRGRKDYGNHPEPYGVKYWEAGNEPWGPDPYGTLPGIDPRKYAESWKDYSRAISKIDPTLSVSISSNCPDSQGGPAQWSAVSIKRLADQASFLHYHPYYPWDRWSKEPLQLYKNSVVAYKGVETSIEIIRSSLKKHHPDRLGKLKVGATEWAPAFGWWGPPMDYASRMAGAIVVADILGTYTQNLDIIEHAQYWLLYSGFYCVLQDGKGPNAPDGFFKHSLYEVFSLFNNLYGDTVLPLNISNAPSFDHDGWGHSIPKGRYPLVTAYASLDNTAVYAVVINKDWDKTNRIDLTFNGAKLAGKAETRLITAQADPVYTAINSETRQEVKTARSTMAVSGNKMTVDMPPVSILGIKIPLKNPCEKVWIRKAGDIATIRRDPGKRGTIAIGDDRSMLLGETGDSIVFPVRLEAGHKEINLRVKGNCDIRLSGTGQHKKSSQGVIAFPTAGMQNGRHYLLITARQPGAVVDRVEVSYNL